MTTETISGALARGTITLNSALNLLADVPDSREA
jgi:hypothetical protein